MSIHVGTVILVPVSTDTEPYEVPMDEIEYNAPILVSRDRFAEAIDSLCMTQNNITLCIPIPDLRRNTYASIEEMVSDAWVSLEPVEIRLIVAIAKSRRMNA